MLPRTRTLILTIAIAGILIATGCDITAFYGEYGDYDEWDDTTTNPDLLAVTQPDGDTYEAGDTVHIAWDGSEQPDSLTIELALSGAVIETLATNHPSDESFSWVIPSDFSAVSEVTNEYQIVVRGYYPAQATGELELVAWSERFTIRPAPTGGLSDLTVSRRDIVITVTDNGAEIDGDTIDVILNGSYIAQSHVLVGGAGTDFALTLNPGDNVLEIYAVNEGSVTPNTALLEVTNVVSGPVAQEWRLLGGETGRLTITAP